MGGVCVVTNSRKMKSNPRLGRRRCDHLGLDLDKVKEFSGLALVDDDEEVVTGFDAKFVGPSAEAESGAVKPGDPGDTATITVSMKLTRINDPSIKIEPPI